MKKHFDFVLGDDPGLDRTIFRFYPRSTHVHGFYDDPPKNWEEVYKVYYSWAIIKQYYEYRNDDSGTKIVPEDSVVLLDFGCDECSMLPDLAVVIKHVMDTGEIYDEPTFGLPAGDWRIEKYEWDDEYFNEHHESYQFYVFDNFSNQGFRFVLEKEEVLKFCDWLDMINQYALDHGEGI